MADIDLAGRRLLVVAEEEFQRVVLDVHDGPVQHLFAALSQLAIARTRLPPARGGGSAAREECAAALDRATTLLERALEEIRVTLTAFRAPEFTGRPLAAIVEEVAVQHETLGGGGVTVDVAGRIPEVPPLVKVALYRVLQEALSNIRRHAGVANAAVRLSAGGGAVCLEITDFGRGFSPPPLVGPGATEEQAHVGLRGMRERAAMLGGTLRVVSRPGAGTRVSVRVPLEA
ncbi:MAG: sensor histidine kinase [Gemmatimonadaceae bacterium]